MSDIPNPIPKIVQATAEKVYDKQFCIKLEINASPDKEWTAKIVGVPFDGTDILRTEMLPIELKDLKALSALDPDLAQAMGGVLAVIGKYLVQCKIKNKRIVTASNIADILSTEE
jgi:hypothetical protein